jgi:hypothetical protein
MNKPWWKSLTLTGATTTALAFLLSPEVFSLLPPQYAKVVGAAGALATVFGLRRSIPDAQIVPVAGDTGTVRVHDPAGVLRDTLAPGNSFGESPAQERERRATMDRVAAENADRLSGRDRGKFG